MWWVYFIFSSQFIWFSLYFNFYFFLYLNPSILQRIVCLNVPDFSSALIDFPSLINFKKINQKKKLFPCFVYNSILKEISHKISHECMFILFIKINLEWIPFSICIQIYHYATNCVELITSSCFPQVELKMPLNPFLHN